VNHSSSRLNKLPGAVCLAGIIEIARCHKQANMQSVRRLLHDESGQDMIEYALVGALVGLAAVLSIKGVTNKIGNTFNSVGSQLTNATA
jgi:pilus assembly protein Flp/PilA